MRSKLCTAALVAWLVTVSGLGWLFVKGWTVAGTDGRTEIVLAPAERDQILAEMRQLLKAIGGVVSGLGTLQQGRKEAIQAARRAGMTMAADVNPAFLAKLPLAFKQMGMSVHQDMDRLAEAMVQGEPSDQLLMRLSSMTARCTTCHDMYRFSAEK